MPSTWMTVTAINNPSGTAAIARMIEVSSMVRKPLPMNNPETRMTAVIATTIVVSVLLKAFKRTCRGVSSSSCSCKLEAILPSSVEVPMDVTSMIDRPEHTVVPMNRPFLPSWTSFTTASDSPVRIASFTENCNPSNNLPSAGMCSPLVSRTRSPGTSSQISTSFLSPSRMTVVVGFNNPFKASYVCWARYSCTKPRITSATTTTMMMAKSPYSPTINDTSAAKRII